MTYENIIKYVKLLYDSHIFVNIFVISTIYGFTRSDMFSYIILHNRTHFHEILIMHAEITGENQKYWCKKIIRQATSEIDKNDQRHAGNDRKWQISNGTTPYCLYKCCQEVTTG